MSHIVTVRTQVRDPLALAAACRRLGLAEPVQGIATLFTTEASGLIVHLPGWSYPVVFQTAAAEVLFDNYNGRWGAAAELDKLLQAYACEKATLEARRRGHAVTEQQLADGSIKLTVHAGPGSVGGAA